MAFPSDWHENRRAWLNLGLGIFYISISIPWKWTVPDEYQCSGPKYGFHFFSDLLWIYYGKNKGRHDDPTITIRMPWQWKHREHKILSESETHAYTYRLRHGEIQEVSATIQAETRTWTRPWIPCRMVRKSISIEFSAEIGEQAGSWKGGVMGCGYDMLPSESPLDTLRRMERDREFR